MYALNTRLLNPHGKKTRTQSLGPFAKHVFRGRVTDRATAKPFNGTCDAGAPIRPAQAPAGHA